MLNNSIIFHIINLLIFFLLILLFKTNLFQKSNCFLSHNFISFYSLKPTKITKKKEKKLIIHTHLCLNFIYLNDIKFLFIFKIYE